MTTTLHPAEQKQADIELAQRINRETRANPDSPYVGKYVVVSGGAVVAVVDTLDETTARLEALGIGPEDSVYIEDSADYDSPIWMPVRVWLDSVALGRSGSK